jgi:hypothetical protein
VVEALQAFRSIQAIHAVRIEHHGLAEVRVGQSRPGDEEDPVRRVVLLRAREASRSEQHAAKQRLHKRTIAPGFDTDQPLPGRRRLA